MRELRSRGIALIEILVVVGILGIVAAVAVPGFRSADSQRLALAAEEIAEAMRFARSQSLRTGQPYGFRQSSANQRIRVFRLDTTTSPWTPVYDVYHPLDRRLYDIKLAEHPFADIDTITSNRVFRGTCNQPRNIYFDASGTPWCQDPETVLLRQYDVTLGLGSASRVVRLHGITGRVTIQ